jgi:hypothetical protein
MDKDALLVQLTHEYTLNIIDKILKDISIDYEIDYAELSHKYKSKFEQIRSILLDSHKINTTDKAANNDVNIIETINVDPNKCSAKTHNGNTCKKNAQQNSTVCTQHAKKS